MRGIRIDPVRAQCLLRIDWIALTCSMRGEAEPRRHRVRQPRGAPRFSMRELDAQGAKFYMASGEDPQMELDLRAELGGASAYEVLVEVAYAVLLVDPRGEDAAQARELQRRAEQRSRATKRFVRQLENRTGVPLGQPLRKAYRRNSRRASAAEWSRSSSRPGTGATTSTSCCPRCARRARRDRVVVVDNGSDDGTAEHLRERYPEVQLVELGANMGFAAAVNRGIEAGDGEFVAVVNNDLELVPGWLEEMVAALREHPGAGSATGKMLFYDRRDTIDGAGDFTSWYAISAPRGRGETDHGQYDAPEPVFSACGGAALYRRAALDAVGLFDEDFFAYAEDVDWGFRAQLAGWTCRYVPRAVAFHMGGATSARVPNLSRYLFFRNTLSLVAKDWPAARWRATRTGWRSSSARASWRRSAGAGSARSSAPRATRCSVSRGRCASAARCSDRDASSSAT